MTPATCLLVGLLDFSSTLKMEALCSSETSVATQVATRRHIPEDDTLHNHRCKNLKSYIIYLSTCLLLNSPKANYKVSTSKEINNKTHTHKKITANQGTCIIHTTAHTRTLYRLDNNNSINAITPTVMQWEEIYIYICIKVEHN
jgi:predicted metal-binding protein